MNRFCLRLPGAFVLSFLLLLPLAAHAQSLPKPKEFYFDEDATTVRTLMPDEGSGDAVQSRLLKTAERNGRDADMATAQLAHIGYATGRDVVGAALYGQVLTRLSGRQRHQVLWNRGWDLHRSGDTEAALADWREAGVDRHGGPSWVPPTLALALWTLDRRDEAVAWYAAAVRTEPSLWADPANLPALLPDWREQERATLAEVAAAWRAAPPAWP